MYTCTCTHTFPLSLDGVIDSEFDGNVSLHSRWTVFPYIGLTHLHTCDGITQSMYMYMCKYTYICHTLCVYCKCQGAIWTYMYMYIYIIYQACKQNTYAYTHVHDCTSTMEKVLMGRAILAQPAKLVTPSGFTLSTE